MIEFIKVILLGIVEGVTEFLPISSTGHLIVAAALLRPGFSASGESSFVLFIQIGAVIAVGLYYLRDLLAQARALPSDRDVQRFWLSIVLAVVPAALIGFLARDVIKDLLFTPVVVAIMLILGGIVFIVFERSPLASRPAQTDMMGVSPRQALIIGIFQTAALIPGVSRAAASILGGMVTGFSREAATRFSFFLALPTL
ncbi:MAG: undecaprenyl-diphosphate phosphatase, partial [Anaerolineae bacterium]|nr:undecaprenyl-diphosphate phosphatase [Anaerolineae bacterium]